MHRVNQALIPNGRAESPTTCLRFALTIANMETAIYSVSVAVFVMAILTFVLVIRDVFPLLDSEDQTSLRDYWTGADGVGTWRKRDRAIKRAWKEHARRFPRSRKRLLFAAALVAAAISLMGYPLWYVLGAK